MLYFQMLRLNADVLLRETSEYARQERWVTARLLVRLAAVEVRELDSPAGYSSMWDYCLGELQMSDAAAGRRLWAARKCREFPALFDALADGHIHLTSIHTLATHLRSDNVDELIAAATGRNKSQLKDWLACRFPRPAVPTEIRVVHAAEARSSDALSEAASSSGPPATETDSSHPPAVALEGSSSGVFQEASHDCTADSHAPARVPVPPTAPNPSHPQVPLRARAHLDPLNADEVRVQFTMPRRVLARMQCAIELPGHAVAPGDVAGVFERALDELLPALEKQKFAGTERPRSPRKRQPTNARSIPAHVKREAWHRDGAQCTFSNATGRRCECRRGLEFEHVKPVALGGVATTENIRLLCRRHNQLEAERRLGEEFMRARRLGAKRVQVAKPEQSAGPVSVPSP